MTGVKVGLASPGLRGRVMLAALVVLPTLLYLPVVMRGFFFGDDYIRVGRVMTRPLALLAADDVVPWFRPLSRLAFAWDYAWWGVEPLGYHLTNLILHVVNTFLVTLLASRLFGLDGPTAKLAGLIFAVHPVQATPVSWISGRDDLLSACGYLGAVLCYDRFRVQRRIGALLALATTFVLALGGKELAVSLPLLLLLLDRLPEGRNALRRPTWGQSLALVLWLGLVLIGFLALRAWVIGRLLGGYGDAHLRLSPWMALDVWLATARIVAPIELIAPTTLRPFRLLIAAGVLAGVAVWLRILYQDGRLPRRSVVLGFLWLLATLAPALPVLFLVQARGVGERYLYLASVGPCAALAALIAQPGIGDPPSRGVTARPGWLAAAVLVAALALLTWHESEGWAAATGAVRAIQRELVRTDVAPGETIFGFAAPEDGHVGSDRVPYWELAPALAWPFFERDLDANPVHLEPGQPFRTFLWEGAGLRPVDNPNGEAATGSSAFWPELSGWTARDLVRGPGGWHVAGPRPALASPPLAISSVMALGIEAKITHSWCRPWWRCKLRRLLAETSALPTWRITWEGARDAGRQASSDVFALPPQRGSRQVIIDLSPNYRWFSQGTIHHLTIEPPPDVAPFEIEWLRIASRADRPVWRLLKGPQADADAIGRAGYLHRQLRKTDGAEPAPRG